jgi:hypothetical protein
MNQISEDALKFLKDSFFQSMESNYLLFEKHAFRKSLTVNEQAANRSVINIALFDVCSVVFSETEPLIIQNNSAKIKEVIVTLLSNDEFNHAITYSTNALKQVVTRFKMIEQVIREAL